jgi:predicted metalloenzyme YecM
METYVLVPFPKSQEYMEEEWFQYETILALGAEEFVGGSAYLISVHRILFEENQ